MLICIRLVCRCIIKKRVLNEFDTKEISRWLYMHIVRCVIGYAMDKVVSDIIIFWWELVWNDGIMVVERLLMVKQYLLWVMLENMIMCDCVVPCCEVPHTWLWNYCEKWLMWENKIWDWVEWILDSLSMCSLMKLWVWWISQIG